MSQNDKKQMMAEYDIGEEVPEQKAYVAIPSYAH